MTMDGFDPRLSAPHDWPLLDQPTISHLVAVVTQLSGNQQGKTEGGKKKKKKTGEPEGSHQLNFARLPRSPPNTSTLGQAPDRTPDPASPSLQTFPRPPSHSHSPGPSRARVRSFPTRPTPAVLGAQRQNQLHSGPRAAGSGSLPYPRKKKKVPSFEADPMS